MRPKSRNKKTRICVYVNEEEKELFKEKFDLSLSQFFNYALIKAVYDNKFNEKMNDDFILTNIGRKI